MLIIYHYKSNVKYKGETYIVTHILNNGHFQLWVSFFIVANVAKHGVYNSTNTKNENADNGVKTDCKADITPIVPDAPNKEVKVLTITSLENTPNIKAIDGCHCPKPKGPKIGAINVPICPVKLALAP